MSQVGQNWETIDTAHQGIKNLPAVLLYSPELVNPDFIPDGIVEGYHQDEEGWIGAVWCGNCDVWHTKQINPTHWMRKPQPPAAAC